MTSYFRISFNYVEKIQVSSKLTKMSGTVRERPKQVYVYISVNSSRNGGRGGVANKVAEVIGHTLFCCERSCHLRNIYEKCTRATETDF
jgi:hypothetical protein